MFRKSESIKKCTQYVKNLLNEFAATVSVMQIAVVEPICKILAVAAISFKNQPLCQTSSEDSTEKGPLVCESPHFLS